MMLDEDRAARFDRLRLELAEEGPNNDGWWTVRASVEGAGSRVVFEGPFFWNQDLKAWIALCRRFLDGDLMQVRLETMEPNLSIGLRQADALGHVEAEVSITADHLNEQHRFLLSGARGDLEAFAKALARAGGEFP